MGFICWQLFGVISQKLSSLGDSVGGSDTGPSVVVGAGASVGVVPSVGVVKVVGSVGAMVVVVSGTGAEQAPMLLHSSTWGLRLSLTRPSMMAGIWDSIKDLQIASGTRAESRSHTCSIH